MRKGILLACGMALTLSACTTTGTGKRPYLRAEDYHMGWNFVGVGFTPGADVALSVFNAPVPCGSSFCGSNAWQPIGTVKAGPIGGTWPTVQGQFTKVILRPEMAQRRGVAVTCYPGEYWQLTHMARDPVTGGFEVHNGSSTAGYFGGLPRCR